MIIVKVWCLPEMTEEQLNGLHEAIVEMFVASETGVKNENDLMVLFPSDMMKYGLGKQIYFEVSGNICINDGYSLVSITGKVILSHFPKSNVYGEAAICKYGRRQFWSSGK